MFASTSHILHLAVLWKFKLTVIKTDTILCDTKLLLLCPFSPIILISFHSWLFACQKQRTGTARRLFALLVAPRLWVYFVRFVESSYFKCCTCSLLPTHCSFLSSTCCFPSFCDNNLLTVFFFACRRMVLKHKMMTFSSCLTPRRDFSLTKERHPLILGYVASLIEDEGLIFS